MATQSLQELVDTVPSIVDHLYKNPPKTALNVFGVMMPTDVVRLEYTTWRDEQSFLGAAASPCTTRVTTCTICAFVAPKP